MILSVSCMKDICMEPILKITNDNPDPDLSYAVVMQITCLIVPLSYLCIPLHSR